MPLGATLCIILLMASGEEKTPIGWGADAGVGAGAIWALVRFAVSCDGRR